MKAYKVIVSWGKLLWASVVRQAVGCCVVWWVFLGRGNVHLDDDQQHPFDVFS